MVRPSWLDANLQVVLFDALAIFMPFQAVVTMLTGVNYLHIGLAFLIIGLGWRNLIKAVRVSWLGKVLIGFVILSFVLTRMNQTLILYGFLPECLFVLLFLSISHTQKIFRHIQNILLFSSIFVSIIAVYQALVDPQFLRPELIHVVLEEQFPRVTSVMPSYQSLSAFLAIVFVINIPRFWHPLVAAILVFDLLALSLTFTRNGYAIVLLGTAFYMMFTWVARRRIPRLPKSPRRIRQGLYGLLIVAMVGAGSRVVPMGAVFERLVSIVDFTSESGNRARLVSYTWYLNNLDADALLVGNGLGTTSRRYLLRTFEGAVVPSPESQFIKLVYEGGILYMILFLGIHLAALAYGVRRTVLPSGRALLALMVVFLPLLAFVHILVIWPINFMYWFGITHLVLGPGSSGAASDPGRRNLREAHG